MSFFNPKKELTKKSRILFGLICIFTTIFYFIILARLMDVAKILPNERYLFDNIFMSVATYVSVIIIAFISCMMGISLLTQKSKDEEEKDEEEKEKDLLKKFIDFFSDKQNSEIVFYENSLTLNTKIMVNKSLNLKERAKIEYVLSFIGNALAFMYLNYIFKEYIRSKEIFEKKTTSWIKNIQEIDKDVVKNKENMTILQNIYDEIIKISENNGIPIVKSHDKGMEYLAYASSKNLELYRLMKKYIKADEKKYIA